MAGTRKTAAGKPAKKATKKVVRKAAKKVVRKAAKKVVRKAASKVVRKATRKAAPKPVKTPGRASRPVPAPAKKPAAASRPAPAPAKKPAGLAAGRFCWFDLMTRDVPGALAFYKALFGWTTHTMDFGPAGTYEIIQAGGVDFGGVMKPPGPGAPPHWLGYVGVADIDATCAAAQREGGTVFVPPTPIPDVGRFAVVADPTGAEIGPIQLAEGPMRDLDRPPAFGMVIWPELQTPNPDQAGPFYSKLFGWTRGGMPMPDGGSYELFQRGDKNEGGMMKLPPGAPIRHGVWVFYFHVADVDASAARATGLGAMVHLPPMSAPGVGRMAVLSDPAGALFAVFRPEMP
jgi:uncharacterized protein